MADEAVWLGCGAERSGVDGGAQARGMVAAPDPFTDQKDTLTVFPVNVSFLHPGASPYIKISATFARRWSPIPGTCYDAGKQ